MEFESNETIFFNENTFEVSSVKCGPFCLDLNVFGDNLGNGSLLKMAMGLIGVLLKDTVRKKLAESKWCHIAVDLIGMQR